MADYFKGIFTVVAGATAGFMTVQIVMAFFAVLFAGSGAYLVWKYNKKTKEGKPTPLLKQMTTLQYIGCALVVIGLIPYLSYFFDALMWGVGTSAGVNVSNDLFGSGDDAGSS